MQSNRSFKKGTKIKWILCSIISPNLYKSMESHWESLTYYNTYHINGFNSHHFFDSTNIIIFSRNTGHVCSLARFMAVTALHRHFKRQMLSSSIYWLLSVFLLHSNSTTKSHLDSEHQDTTNGSKIIILV